MYYLYIFSLARELCRRTRSRYLDYPIKFYIYYMCYVFNISIYVYYMYNVYATNSFYFCKRRGQTLDKKHLTIFIVITCQDMYIILYRVARLVISDFWELGNPASHWVEGIVNWSTTLEAEWQARQTNMFIVHDV